MHFRTTVRSLHCSHKNKKIDDTKCWWGCGGTGMLYTAGRNIKRYSHFGKKLGCLLKSNTYIYSK